MKWKIGNVVIKNQVVMAPMAGISNSAYRKIIKEMGCGLIYAEMVSDKAIMYENKKTIDMLYMDEKERPIVQQIFGTDVESFVIAAKYIYQKMKPDIIDINMGCPVPKVAIKAQAGAALLKSPTKIYEIVKAVVEAVPIPISVKIRSGWDQNHINAVEIAKVIEQAGASAICIHPRTRKQGYSGKANWDIIKEVKRAVSIPVIGNGDIKTAQDAKRMIEETSCDAVMIGRAILGNPWLIKETVALLDDKKSIPKPTTEERINMCLKHINYLEKIKPEKIVRLEIRNHISWYLKGLPKANEIKNKVYQCLTIRDIIHVLKDYKEELNHDKE